jgi:membrane protease YdiL (CAAX protease family)
VGWFVVVVVGTIIASGVLLVPLALVFPDALSGSNFNGATAVGAWGLAISQLLFYAGMASWPLIAGAWKADGWRRAYGFVVTRRALWIGVVGGLVTLVAMSLLTSITAELLNRDINSAGAEVAETMSGSTAAYGLFLLLIALVAPFVEEVTFRGLVWGAAAKHGWSPWLATVTAGVPFALIHVEPLRVAPLLAAGLVLGTVRQFGGLGAAMLAHAVVNVIGVISILAA